LSLKQKFFGFFSTPFIIQLNGYFAIVTERVTGIREVQKKPIQGKSIPEKKMLHPSGKKG